MCARTIDRYLLEGLLTRRNVSQQAEAAMHIARRRLGLYREREREREEVTEEENPSVFFFMRCFDSSFLVAIGTYRDRKSRDEGGRRERDDCIERCYFLPRSQALQEERKEGRKGNFSGSR